MAGSVKKAGETKIKKLRLSLNFRRHFTFMAPSCNVQNGLDYIFLSNRLVLWQLFSIETVVGVWNCLFIYRWYPRDASCECYL
jgi:hypothetical protein